MNEKEQFGSVTEMLRETSGEPDLVRDIERRISARRLIKNLIAHRAKSRMSQQDIAQRLGCTQSRISKLESSNDDNIRLGDLKAYAQAIGLQLECILASQKDSVADEVKYYAMRIEELLRTFADSNDSNGSCPEETSRFAYVETPLNLLNVIVDAAMHLPRQPVEEV